MIRNIVKIDEEKCTGCGQCVTACAEGAIAIIDGKARLISDVYCDGLGACLGECPEGAITIEQRQAEAFDEEAAKKHIEQQQMRQFPEKKSSHKKEALPCGCSGMMERQLQPGNTDTVHSPAESQPSQLGNWPVQLKLVSPQAAYFQDADLLLVADCVPFAFADFHRQYLRGNPVVVGCPKLDDGQYYVEKLTDILKASTIKSLTVMRMEVPCCSGLSRITEMSLAASGKNIPICDVTVGIQGEIVNQ